MEEERKRLFPDIENFEEAEEDMNDEMIKDQELEAQQQWSHPSEFLFSCISMSVGLGNVWRFPTTAFQNGGGAFLIPYLIVLIFIGRPVYFLELALGQFSSLNSVAVWNMVPASKGIGYGQLVSACYVATYYGSVMALTVYYLVMSFSKVLPWSVCDDAWADENCVDSSSTNVTYTDNLQSSSEQYYYRYVLHMKEDISDGIGLPDWRLALCLLLFWVVLFFTVAWGIKSSGKVAYFTALFPYVSLVTLLLRGMTLPGAFDGMLYFITPNFKKLLDPYVWLAAVTQAFFSLSVGFGAVITLASYNSFCHDIYRDAWIISLADTFTSLLAGFTIFAILGNLAHQLDTNIEDVVRDGGGLAFVSYPDALAKFTWAPQLFAVLFFLMLFTLGIGSLTGTMGNVIGVITFNIPSGKRVYATLGICITNFLFGLIYITPGGQWIMNLVDYFGGGFITYVLVLLEVVSVSYIYGLKNFIRDLNFMTKRNLGLFWKFSWKYFIPVTLLTIFVQNMVHPVMPTVSGASFPQIAYVCGWILASVAVGMVPICLMHTVYHTQGDTLVQLRDAFRPTTSWGPRNWKDRALWQK
ncbi:sodium-dependent nutrient amino acid transporter 1-like isoform X2 [Scylla paramamosain]|uniref:sodium-dependent nutrient amino acid transporter 1-like isoform X2 n=1 Tax=Scylla paramamosain TaxID=85552 RepID=UPI00308395BE